MPTANKSGGAYDACNGRILFAEDSPVTQDLIKLLMLQRGHTVDLASSGTEACEMARENSYSVIALDYHLPDMDGLKTALQIVDDVPEGERPWLVAVSGDVPALLGRGRASCVFDRIMPKPANASIICDAVSRLASEAATTPFAYSALATEH